MPEYRDIVDFVEFDPKTGDVLVSGQSQYGALKHVIEVEGRHILLAKGDFRTDRVDIKTGQVERKPDAPVSRAREMPRRRGQ